jgi:general secretion pathway protein K
MKAVRAAPGSRPREAGFVLALTVVILAAVAIAAAFIAERVASALETARVDRAASELQIEAFSLRSQLLFRMAVEPRRGNTLGSLRVDGTPYAAGTSLVRLDDARGLFNPNAAAPVAIIRFVTGFGVPPLSAAALADVLLDFRDGDNLTRLNGAEAADYLRLGLPPPRNGPFVAPTELRRLPVWRDASPLWDAGLLDELALHGSELVNPETASAATLRSLPGIDAALASELVALRESGTIIGNTVRALVNAAGGGGLYSPIATVPSDTLVVTHWADRPGWALRYAVTHTPNSAYGPWRIEYSYRVGRPQVDQRAVALPAIVTGGDRPPPPVVLPGGGH